VAAKLLNINPLTAVKWALVKKYIKQVWEHNNLNADTLDKYLIDNPQQIQLILNIIKPPETLTQNEIQDTNIHKLSSQTHKEINDTQITTQYNNLTPMEEDSKDDPNETSNTTSDLLAMEIITESEEEKKEEEEA
jgi:hypothetical protein